MNDLNILTGVPIPSTNGLGKWSSLQKRMNIGDCVDVDTAKAAHGMRMALTNNGFKPVTRKQPDGKFRVWKTAK